MKLLTVTIPCYNSQNYMTHAIDSLLPGGEDVEIIVVNDGSNDDTAKIADDYERRYPGIVRAIHKENGGHGDAIMTGLANADGLYFKAVDSDDWVDAEAFTKVLDALRTLSDNPVDMFISNYIYDKAAKKHKLAIRYHNILPQHRVFGWDETKRFHIKQYLLIHSLIYRTGLLRECGLSLPKHTYYVDNLYTYLPLKDVKKMYYLDVDLYHYFIGRKDQSIQEQNMTKNIDQQLLVNKLLISQFDPFTIENLQKRKYLLHAFAAVTIVSIFILTKSGTKESLQKRKDLLAFIRQKDPRVYQRLRRDPFIRICFLPGKAGRAIPISIYKLLQKIYGFN